MISVDQSGTGLHVHEYRSCGELLPQERTHLPSIIATESPNCIVTHPRFFALQPPTAFLGSAPFDLRRPQCTTHQVPAHENHRYIFAVPQPNHSPQGSFWTNGRMPLEGKPEETLCTVSLGPLPMPDTRHTVSPTTVFSQTLFKSREVPETQIQSKRSLTDCTLALGSGLKGRWVDEQKEG